MIARVWHGVTRAEHAEAYLAFLRARALSEYRAIAGNLAAYVLRRIEGDQAHFLTLTFWASKDAIRSFAGPEIDQAKYYPEDREFLLEFEASVLHYEVYPAQDLSEPASADEP